PTASPSAREETSPAPPIAPPTPHVKAPEIQLAKRMGEGMVVFVTGDDRNKVYLPRDKKGKAKKKKALRVVHINPFCPVCEKEGATEVPARKLRDLEGGFSYCKVCPPFAPKRGAGTPSSGPDNWSSIQNQYGRQMMEMSEMSFPY